MKKVCLILSFSLLLAFPVRPDSRELDSILLTLDRTIKDKGIYSRQKEQHILDLKQLLRIKDITPEQHYDINTRLYNEYKSFIPDSAIVYTLRNLHIAESMGNAERIEETKISLAMLYAVAGMYIDAEKLLLSVDAEKLPDWLLQRYYDSFKQLYSFYPSGKAHDRYYGIYRDSLLVHLEAGSNDYKIVYAEKLTLSGKYEEARKLLLPMFDEADEESHWRAVLAYTIGDTYRGEGNYEMQKKYYAISAISDIRNAIKENASMRALAIAFYETNELERAYKYVRQSMEDAVFSNAYFRTMELAQVFPVIEKSYQHKIEGQKDRLYFLLVCIGLLSLFLAIAIIYVYIQLRKLAKVRKSLSEANRQLKDLNIDLQNNNRQMAEINRELSEANLLKETYISQFLDICSMYINKLEKYQNSLNRKAMERKLEELYGMLKSKDMIEAELKDLYEMFDNIFLHLYPDFVEEFNALLIEEERFELKQNEFLNPELRIFALIRLGITDSSRIAGFLRYSATTIYNYRTRVRNKSAVPREEFENRVMKIGLIVR